MYQAFSFGGYSFYLLDTSDRSVSKAQLSKLKQALKNDSQPKLFLTHYPLAADSMYRGTPYGVDDPHLLEKALSRVREVGCRCPDAKLVSFAGDGESVGRFDTFRTS